MREAFDLELETMIRWLYWLAAGCVSCHVFAYSVPFEVPPNSMRIGGHPCGRCGLPDEARLRFAVNDQGAQNPRTPCPPK
jgi:hypothetical protein